MRPAPHYPKCKCAECVAWRGEVRREHDERERQRELLPVHRVPRGWLSSQPPSVVFEHDLA